MGAWDLFHMNKMATMAIYGKKTFENLLRTERPCNLVLSIGDSGHTKFVQIMTIVKFGH